MPFKFNQKNKKHIKKAKYKIINWSSYNKSLITRGNLEIWLSGDVKDWWFKQDRIYDGNGAPYVYTNQAIITCYKLKLLFKLPLRQTQGFIDSLFKIMKIDINCPNYSALSKRFTSIGLKLQDFINNNQSEEDIVAIAIDSTGLKRFGRDEWHQEKHKISANRSWRKLHIAVDINHNIQACQLTDKYASDSFVVLGLIDQIKASGINQITADGGYDSNLVYKSFSNKFPKARIVIPPSKTSKLRSHNHEQRNENIRDNQELGRQKWQKINNYGNRNKSETVIQRYKKIIGNKLHSRLIDNQTNEVIIGCAILNKMTSLGMPKSQKIA